MNFALIQRETQIIALNPSQRERGKQQEQ